MAGRGRPKAELSLSDVERETLVRWSQPKDATHWSRASMAKRSGLSRSTVGRIWKAVWTKTADEILNSIAAFRQRTSGAGHQEIAWPDLAACGFWRSGNAGRRACDWELTPSAGTVPLASPSLPTVYSCLPMRGGLWLPRARSSDAPYSDAPRGR